ncbi:hypothetical protein RvY_10444 [Ramazzottius varieornatus]|uniref:DNL-type domain-containing protein n=1 Tax=Ramazzottius varieornatus TaxID=947166 RepID=A0A1D1VCT4_RAMVA|nr:hypothetical protein RvY_10444 [Ramazzottius varieornatus]
MIPGIIRHICRRSATSIISASLIAGERTTPRISAAYLLRNETFHSSARTRGRLTTEAESLPKSAPLTQIQLKIALGFTCKPCGQRVNRLISRVAYTRGLVLVRCPGCKNVHLIADNIGWFKELAPGVRNIEEILASKGESVRKHLDENEAFEIEDFPPEVSLKLS